MAIGTALLAVSVGQGLYSAWQGGRNRRRQRDKKRSFFDKEISPLLAELNEDQDIDYDSLYNAEMAMPLANMQQGIRSLARTKDSTYGQSGLQSSAFIDNDHAESTTMLQNQFDNQKFQAQRGIIDLQSQMESMATNNRLRAKELEYSYKYG